MKRRILLLGLLAGGCSDASEGVSEAAQDSPVPAEAAQQAAGPPAGATDAPGPVDEAPVDAQVDARGVAAAAILVRTYFELLEEGRYGEARRLWSDAGEASGKFAGRFARHAEVHADIGIPRRVEGAAGSLYVEVPVRLYGHLAEGGAFSRTATVRLRRANDVAGATPEQLQWRIVAIEDA